MDNREQFATGSVSEEASVNEMTCPQVDSVKLVEMGEVSVETKGTVHGLELGFTPRYF